MSNQQSGQQPGPSAAADKYGYQGPTREPYTSSGGSGSGDPAAAQNKYGYGGSGSSSGQNPQQGGQQPAPGPSAAADKYGYQGPTRNRDYGQ